jgi:class 3 adenylate cyclase/tetratricopeptide (TPR) repeat protein
MSARKTVTIVFCDIANSTPLGEALDPEVLRGVMEQYFEVVRLELERHGGTVEKFIGDAVVAVFGIPTAHDDDALRAVRAAVDMRTALGALNAELEATHGVRLALRTGVNTGEVVAGDPSARDSTFATGAAVTMAQRLEAAAHAGEILVGEPTYKLVSNAALVEPLDPLTLKGFAEPVTAWRLLGVVEGAPPFSRRLDAPMVGRQDELAALRAELEQTVRERRCRLATIVGPAGIGKSRLGNELFATVRGEAMTLVGRCLAYGEGITYWPLRGVVLSAAGSLTKAGIEQLLEDSDDAAQVAERLSEAVGTTEPAHGGEETFWAVRRFFEHLARDRTVIVGIDELQWAEPTFLDLIEYLVGWTSDASVLLVGLSRPELLERRPTWPSTSSLVLPLGPLLGGDAVQLVEVLGGETLGQKERSRILQGAEGNPLFVEQMLALAVEGPVREKIPPSIQALLAARLDRLPSDERAVLERAAVIGREFTAGAVTALSGEPVAATLLSLVRRDLIEPDRSLIPGDDGFRFRHILIRDAAYLAVAKRTRAELHERYADWLEGAAPDLHELVGYHLEQAFRYGQELGTPNDALATRAGELLAKLGRRARGRGDLPAAVNLLTRAIALLPDSNDERRGLLGALGGALIRTGDFERAESVLDDALAAARAAGDERLELRTLIEREFFRVFTSPEDSVEEIIAVADNAIPLLEQLGDDLGLAKAWWLKSEVHVHACRWGARAEHLERALDHAKRAGDRAEQATIASQLSLAVYYGPTPVPAAILRCEQLLTEVPSNRSLEASVTGALAGLRAMQGEFDEARRLQEEARAVSEELGHRFRIAVRSLIAAEIELLAGDPAEAVSILRWGHDQLSDMGVQSVIPTVSAFLADALCEAGRFDEAERFARDARDQAVDVDTVAQVMWRVALSRATVDMPLAREAVALAEKTDHLDLQAKAFAAAGDPERARRAYEAKGNVAAVRRLLAHQGASS